VAQPAAPKASPDKPLDAAYESAVRRLLSAAGEAGSVSPEELAAIERMSKALDYQRALEKQRRQKRWPLVTGAALTLALILILATNRVTETEVDLDATVTGLEFTIGTQGQPSVAPESTPLLGDIALANLDLQGLRSVTASFLTGTLAPLPIREAYIGPASEMRGTPVSAPAITLQGLSLSPGSSVTVTTAAGSNHVGIEENQNSPIEIPVSAEGSLDIVLDAETRKQELKTPKSLDFESAADPNHRFVAELSPAPPAGLRFNPSTPISRLSLIRQEDVYQEHGREPRLTSTILSGVIRLEALDKERPLRDYDWLRFESANGVLRSVTVSEFTVGQGAPGQRSLRVRFSGVARGMKIGRSAGTELSLMPTWLEWLTARHAATLAWSSLIYVVGLILGVLKWLEIEH
jgi:hypothetical protein